MAILKEYMSYLFTYFIHLYFLFAYLAHSLLLFNKVGCLGMEHFDNINAFTLIKTLPESPIKKVYAVYKSCFLLTENGELWVAGDNNLGQLGLANESVKKVNTFTLVETLPTDPIKEIVLLKESTFILTENHQIWSCGNNKSGQLAQGNNTNNPTFTQVELPDAVGHIQQLAGKGSGSIYLLSQNGTVWSCGRNSEGQLGLGDFEPRNVFTQITIFPVELFTIKKIVSAETCLYIWLQDDSIYACGENKGNLGIGNEINQHTLIHIPFPHSYVPFLSPIPTIEDICATGLNLYVPAQTKNL